MDAFNKTLMLVLKLFGISLKTDQQQAGQIAEIQKNLLGLQKQTDTLAAGFAALAEEVKAIATGAGVSAAKAEELAAKAQSTVESFSAQTAQTAAGLEELVKTQEGTAIEVVEAAEVVQSEIVKDPELTPATESAAAEIVEVVKEEVAAEPANVIDTTSVEAETSEF